MRRYVEILCLAWIMAALACGGDEPRPAHSVDDDTRDDDDGRDADEPGCASDAQCRAGEICVAAACVEGCRVPADCQRDQTCRAQRCVEVECTDDLECGRGEQCQQGACEQIGAAPCEQNSDCGRFWTCSQAGVCVEGECRDHRDCSPEDRCEEGVCVRRATSVWPIRLARVRPATLDAHQASARDTDGTGYGFGGGLMDIDGDGDQDVFLGARVPERDSPPCLYRNVSTPGALAFEPVEALCDHERGLFFAAWGIDDDGDGRDAVLLLGAGLIQLARIDGDAVEVEDLMALLEPDDPRRACVAGAALHVDLDLDGVADLLIGCQRVYEERLAPSASDAPLRQNIALRGLPGGGFERPPQQEGSIWEASRDSGVSLALGALDVDRDGLLDVWVADDTFTTSQQAGTIEAGGVYRRCAPDQGCAAELWRVGEGAAASGSFMGLGQVRVDGLGDHVYVTDQGANRLVRFEPDGRSEDVAATLGVELGVMESQPLFSWGAVVEDFDRNGLDDLLVTQGMVIPDLPAELYEQHRDVLLAQRAGGSFEALTDEAGLGAQTLEDARSETTPYASRGAVKADLDLDGGLEVLVVGLQGGIKLYSEPPPDDGDPPRCTLVPRARVVPVAGFGVEVAGESGDFRGRDIQGQLRLGAPSSILSSVGRGRARFPSSAVVEFDCQGEAGPVVVEEPDWVGVEWDGQGLLVRVEAPWSPGGASQVEVALEVDGEVTLYEAQQAGDERWRVEEVQAGQRAMIRVDGRWVARWWPL